MKTLNFTQKAKLLIDDVGSFLFNGGKLFTNGDEVATKVDLESYQDISGAGQPYGYPTLDMEGEIPSSQLPALAKYSVSIVQTIVERDAIDYQLHGDKCFVIDTGETFIWDDNAPAWRLQAETQFEDISLTWDSISDKPSTFTPSSHGDGAHSENYAKTTQLFSGSYLDLSNKPSLFSGSYGDLSNVPSTFAPSSHGDGAHSENYAKTTQLFSGSYNDLTNVPSTFTPSSHGDGAHSENYAKTTQLFSGSYLDLTDKPSLFSGSYGDLTNVPSTFTPSSHGHSEYLAGSGGGNNGQFITKYLGTSGGSQRSAVVLIHRPDTSGAYTRGFLEGKRHRHGSLGLTHFGFLYGSNPNNRFFIETYDFDLGNTNPPHRMVTCTYNGDTWYAIDMQSGSWGGAQHGVWFTGVHHETHSDCLKLIPYDDSGTTLNSEIKNSISVVTDDALRKQINGKRVATTGQLFSGSYGDLSSVPSTFTPSSHNNSSHSETYYKSGDSPTFSTLTLDKTLSDGEILWDFPVHRNFSIRRRGGSDASANLSIESQVGGNYWQFAHSGDLIAEFHRDRVNLEKPTYENGNRVATTGQLFSGSYGDLTNVPSTFAPSTHGDGAHSENYAKTTQLFSGSYNDLTNKPTLFSGSYGDLSNVPSTFNPSSHGHSEYKEVESYTNSVSTGWRTIAYNTGNRASATFVVRDTQSGRHSTTTFIAQNHYASHGVISVLAHDAHGTSQLIDGIRMLSGGTYDGAVLQVRASTSGNVGVWMYDNYQSSGWTLVNFSSSEPISGLSQNVYVDLRPSGRNRGIANVYANNKSGFMIQKNGTDGTGIINFKT